MRRAFGVARVVAAVAGMVALVGDLGYSLGGGAFATWNFFSYFTVQSMIAAVVVFAVGAVNALRKPVDPLWLDEVRVYSTTYVVVSGIVFAFILVEGSLRGIPVWAPWSSMMLHFWIPAYALIDWLIAPGRDVPWRTIGWAMVFPVLWLVFTLVRGGMVQWYPYFFLDPVLVEAPFELGFYLLIVIAIIAGINAAIIAVSRLPRLEHLRERWGRDG